MNPTSNPDPIELVARALPQHAARLSRLLVASIDTRMSRSELSVLSAVAEAPKRVTELAEAEGLAQPTVTQMVNGLEKRGHVSRRKDPDDGRAVLVELTEEGSAELERCRAEIRAWLRPRLAELPDREVDELAGATLALAGLLDELGRRR